MKDTTETICDRNDDLIAFLYHELDEKGARNFQRHLLECVRCERDLASFGEIRESILTWREASLGAASSIEAMNGRQSAFAEAVVARAPRHPSALAAIREFFSLSPMWMKGAAVFASLLFCLCAALAIVYVKGRDSVVVQSPSDKIYSRQELDTEVARALQIKTEESRNAQNDQAAKAPVKAVDSALPKKRSSGSRHLEPAGYAVTTKGLRKPLTRQERRELAADLGLLVSLDDEDLDLVTDRITRAP
ncbi:MAG: hypothetical protein JWM21_1118 [Acidobacteria bacterium]|nr:hypothetical protein [Acidobacteriota bacterium]